MPLAECWQKRKPSINPVAFGQLRKILNDKFRVFEFGTGGSTIWLAKRVAELVSVEHNKHWFRILKEGMVAEFGKIPGNVRLMLRTGTPVLNDVWVKSETTGESIGLDFIDSILEYPDDYFDLVIVDGRARKSCLFNSLSKVKPGGYIVLDDSQREWYREGVDMMADWEVTVCGGVKTKEWLNGLAQTTFFRRPNE